MTAQNNTYDPMSILNISKKEQALNDRRTKQREWEARNKAENMVQQAECEEREKLEKLGYLVSIGETSPARKIAQLDLFGKSKVTGDAPYHTTVKQHSQSTRQISSSRMRGILAAMENGIMADVDEAGDAPAQHTGSQQADHKKDFMDWYCR